MNLNSKRPVMLLVLLFVALFSATAISAGANATPRRIYVTAHRFAYEPSEITLKKGEPVIIVLHSTDVTHGLKIPDLGVLSEVKKGHDAEIALTPTALGRFQGKCAHFCGKGHGSMIFEVNVVE
ncbi:MAG: cupredoxin domain-containing protein [Candidatus Acidiferrales bacterium]